MEQKIKFVLIGLVGVLAVFIFLFITTLNAKNVLTREKEELKAENAALNTKIDKISAELRRKQDEAVTLQKNLADLNKAKAELESKYESLIKERQALVDQMKGLKSKGSEPAAVPQADDAYWGAVIRAKTDLELQLESVRNELKSVQLTNEQFQREKSAVELEITNLNRDREDLRRQVEYNQKLVDSISAELAREKNDKMRIEANYKPVKNENTVLRRQLESLTSRKINLEKKLIDLQEQKNTIERRFNEMEAMLRDKMNNISDFKQKLSTISADKSGKSTGEEGSSVELPPIVVRPQPESPSFGVTEDAAGLAGTILTVNRENNFVVIDLGEGSGVKAGDVFKVYRDGQNIAAIEVIKTRESISACDIKRQSSPVKVGDLIKS